MTTKRSYPWEQFWSWAERRGLAMNTIAQRIGSDRRELYRWRERGAIPEAGADRLALALGTMPGEIWPSWHDDALEAEASRRRARRAATMRRYRARNPDYAERQRAAAREYKAYLRQRRQEVA